MKKVKKVRLSRRFGRNNNNRLEFCAQDESMFLHPDNAKREAVLDKIKGLGATCVRSILYTHLLHPCRGPEALEQLNRYIHLVKAARARGLRVQFTITGVAAQWGTPLFNGRGCALPTGLNPKPKDLAKFIGRVVPVLVAHGARRFSVWNEPNNHHMLCANGKVNNATAASNKCVGSTLATQAKLYRRLYITSWNKFESLKKLGRIPQATQVLIGEINGARQGEQFMKTIIRGNRPLVAHGFAVHPLQFCTSPASRKFNFRVGTCKRKMEGGVAWTPRYNALLKKFAATKALLTPRGNQVPLFLTEFGYQKAGPWAIPEAIRAKWYPLAMEVARRSGARQMNIYQMYQSTGRGWDSSLLNARAEPLPSYIALQGWAKKQLAQPKSKAKVIPKPK